MGESDRLLGTDLCILLRACGCPGDIAGECRTCCPGDGAIDRP